MKRERRTIGFDVARGAGAHREVAPTLTTTANTGIAVLNTRHVKTVACKRSRILEQKDT